MMNLFYRPAYDLYTKGRAKARPFVILGKIMPIPQKEVGDFLRFLPLRL